jgi:hypothetical protein
LLSFFSKYPGRKQFQEWMLMLGKFLILSILGKKTTSKN